MDVPLPPAPFRQGGQEFKDDDYFVASGFEAVEHLRRAGMKSDSRVLDIGCGPGRLAIGLIRSYWYHGDYLGVEVQERHVAWCTAEISSKFPSYRFVRINAPNPRYNPAGSEPHELPVADEAIDLVCALSVFTHMLGEDVSIYLQEVRRVLAPDGFAYVSAFMEEGVPPETENPRWFGDWTQPLHCVLYSADRLHELIEGAGLMVETVIPYRNRQKALTLRPSLPDTSTMQNPSDP